MSRRVAAIETVGLTKRYGDMTAVNDLSFSIREGAVTGFLGPNGAGKTTTLRMILALARPSAGHATALGRPYVQLDDPARTVGAVIVLVAWAAAFFAAGLLLERRRDVD